MSRSDLFMGRGNDFSPVEATPSDKYPKVVSFEFPPKEVDPAPCHSPSWEAYERRKTEKKAEKQEREDSRNRRTKRLVKPPPTSSPYSLQQAAASELDASRGRRRERSDSSTTLNSPNKPARKARSRSGSFVSLLRAPFEFRRSSVDHGADSGFIGGIKLEIQRHASAQQVLDNQTSEDESNIHPALRKGKPNQRWSAPLKSPPPPPRAGVDGSDNQRRYPPITRGNAHHKTMSLVSPTAPAIPDLSTIDKWRAKCGLKSGSRPDSRIGPGHDSHLNGASAAAPLNKQNISAPRDAKPAQKPRATSSSLPKPLPLHIAYAASPPPREKMLENKPKLEHSNNMSISSCSTGETYRTAPSSPPPPEPPRRSSKRNSVLSLNSSIPPLPSPPHQFSVQSSPIRANASKPRSFPLCPEGFNSKKSTKTQTVSVPVPISQPSLYVPSPGFHLPGSSSEDSGSDDFHSPSNVSTPATSRPQSERDLCLVCTKDEPTKLDDKTNRSQLAVPNSTYPLHSAENSDDEGLDPIQAAAERVLAVFNEIPVQQRGLRRRSNSQSTLATDASFPASSLRERPLKLRPKNKAGVPLQNPSSYLEEARKQPPAAPTPRTPKQRFGPPASFVIPDSDSDATTVVEPQIPSVPDIVGRSLRHKSTPLLSMSDREPIAKVFVECCSCKFYHDMPSNLYEAMANPEGVLSPADKCGYSGALSMTVKCSWCKHEMSTRCCAGLAATVYIKERLH